MARDRAPDVLNPYIAGNPVTGREMFFGREDVFAYVRDHLTGKYRDNVIVLYGQRRTGKTSVLYQMGRRLDTRYLCVFVDLHGLALHGLGGFLWELANHIVRVLRRNYHLAPDVLPRLDATAFSVDPRSQFENDFLPHIWSVIAISYSCWMRQSGSRSKCGPGRWNRRSSNTFVISCSTSSA